MDFEHILDDLFLKLNEVRLHPRGVLQKLEQLRPSYNGNIFRNKVRTREGIRAVDDLLRDLHHRQGLNRRLKWSFALHLAADHQASILGECGLVTTEGTFEHKPLPDRIQEYAIIKGRITEVYEFGGRSAEEILEELLIDDGLASRKRRNTLLDPIFNYIGIGCSYHEKYEACTVIILAEDIVSLGTNAIEHSGS